MSDMLEYRGYLGSVLYNDEDEILHGRLEFIRDLVTYEGQDAVSLKHAFREAVDDYLSLCEERREESRTFLSRAVSMSDPDASFIAGRCSMLAVRA